MSLENVCDFMPQNVHCMVHWSFAAKCSRKPAASFSVSKEGGSTMACSCELLWSQPMGGLLCISVSPGEADLTAEPALPPPG